VREFCECAFGYLGLDYRDYVREGSAAYRPVEVVQLIGKSEKARRSLSWVPELGFRELVSMMVDSDLRMLRKKIDTKC
jgi:GDPmannose 4,6-dehydratase